MVFYPSRFFVRRDKNTLEIPVIQTERLKLRGFLAGDVEPFAAMCADPEVIRYASFAGRPLSLEESRSWVSRMQAHWQERNFGMWAVVDRQSGRFLGRIGLQQPEGYPGVEIAWMLARNYWGQGFAYEGCMAAIEWGFSYLDQQFLISLIFPENQRSIRLAERLGESLIGSIQIQGKHLLQYRISRKDWAALGQRSTPNERYQKN